MPWDDLAPLGFTLATVGFSDGTTWVEATTTWWVDGAGWVAAQDNTLARPCGFGIRDGDSGEQGLCVWMQWVRIKFIAAGQFDDDTQVHHGYTVADMAHHAQVMGDEQIG